MKTLIIGVGNTLRGDDGIGFRVAEMLTEQLDNATVTVIIGHQLLPEMAESISLARKVIFIDASVLLAPGTIQEQVVTSQLASQTMGHHLVPFQLLQVAEQLFGGCPEAHLVSVGVQCMDIGDQLSDRIQSVLPDIIALVKSML